jgi:hypothetical protein
VKERLWGVGRKLNAAGVARLEPGRRLGERAAVDAHGTFVDQLLQITARELGKHLGQHLVQALAVVCHTGDQRAPFDLRTDVGQPVHTVFGIGRRRVSRYNRAGFVQQGVPHVPVAKLSMARVLLLAAATMLFAGCSSAPKDNTAGWSPNRLYAEAKDEMNSGSYDKAVELLEKLEGRAAGTLLAQQAQLEQGLFPLPWR